MSDKQVFVKKPTNMPEFPKDDPKLWVKSPYPDIDPVIGVELHEFVFKNILPFGNRPALTCPVSGKCLTYRQVLDQARAFGAALIKSGQKKDDIAAIILLNCVEYPVALLGCWCAGMTVVTLNPRFTISEIAQQFKFCDIRVVITDSTCLDKIPKGEDETVSAPTIILVDKDVVESNMKSYEEMVETDSDEISFSSGKGTDTTTTLAWLGFSSGTTGPPKLVMVSHAQLLLTTKHLSLLFQHVSLDNNGNNPEGQQQRFVAIFPFFHAAGLLLHILAPFCSGAHTVVMSRFQSSGLLNIMRDHKVNIPPPTTLHLPAPLVAHIVNAEEFTKKDLESVHTIMCGGAPIGAFIINKIIEKAAHYIFIQECYAMTELLPITFLDGASKNKKIGSCGPCVPSVIVKVIDTITGETLGPHKRGELLAKGPLKPLGYFRDEEATRHLVDEEGWVHTGDVGYYDEDGYFYVVDRIKELIKVKAFQVAPSELENLLRKHPDVADCAVIGIPSEEHGEVPRAIVVSKSKDLSEEEIRAYINPMVATYKQLKGGVEFVESIAKTPTGKILRRELREQYIKKCTEKCEF